MEHIKRHFPDLPSEMLQKFAGLEPLYREWNEKINVISRKDIEFFEERHLLHSLAIARYFQFPAGSRLLDLGTGGGFPGIPLAIFFPECKFTLCDSIGKKIKVVQAVIDELQLTNATAINTRAEQLKPGYDFVVTRAVAPLETLWRWSKPLIRSAQPECGIFALKGGDLHEEISEVDRQVNLFPLSKWLDMPYFESKFLLHLWAGKKFSFKTKI